MASRAAIGLKKEIFITVTAEDYANEEWRSIPDFNEYEASSLGRVRRIKSKRPSIVGRVLKPDIHQKGYLRLVLTKGNKSYHISPHRLVALAFLPNPENKPEVNHKNFNRVDCRVENLEWTTKLENIQYSVDAGRTAKGELNGGAKFKDVEICDKINLGHGYSEIASEYNISTSHVTAIAYGKLWSHITEGKVQKQIERYQGIKLNEEKRKQILELVDQGYTNKEIGDMFGTGASIVSYIRNRDRILAKSRKDRAIQKIADNL